MTSTWTAVFRVLWPNGHSHSTTGWRNIDLLGPAAGVAYSFCSFSSRRRPTTPSINNIASPTISRQPDTICLRRRRLLDTYVRSHSVPQHSRVHKEYL